MPPNSVLISTPTDFSFRSTVYSHGWSELLPFELDVDAWRLTYVFTDSKGRSATGAMSEAQGGIHIELSSSRIDLDSVTRDARHILRLDEDLTSFYELTDGHEHLAWIRLRRAGRLIRSATVWEDLVKTMCTTNCSWGLTKIMVRNLVEKLGQPAGTQAPSPRVSSLRVNSPHASKGPTQDEGRHAFPTPIAMASVPESFYRTEIKAGYRSPYFVELADAVASGLLDPETWLNSPLSGPELRKEMKKVKGIGDYAADNLLKLVGKYDGLALDSWLRSQFYKKYNKEKTCKDTKIERHYKKFGNWRGLVIWCDMTEKWIV